MATERKEPLFNPILDKEQFMLSGRFVRLPSGIMVDKGYDMAGRFHGSIIMPNHRVSVNGFTRPMIEAYQVIKQQVQGVNVQQRIVDQINEIISKVGWDIKDGNDDDEEGMPVDIEQTVFRYQVYPRRLSSQYKLQLSPPGGFEIGNIIQLSNGHNEQTKQDELELIQTVVGKILGDTQDSLIIVNRMKQVFDSYEWPGRLNQLFKATAILFDRDIENDKVYKNFYNHVSTLIDYFLNIGYINPAISSEKVYTQEHLLCFWAYESCLQQVKEARKKAGKSLRSHLHDEVRSLFVSKLGEDHKWATLYLKIKTQNMVMSEAV